MPNRIQLIKGDITKVEVDAVVNAANSSLLGGGGVDGAIHRAGGPAILEACQQIRARQGGCPPGDAVHTTAGDLPAKYVIHTVGPIWPDNTPEINDQLLASCYAKSLSIAEALALQSVAFPNISTGVYRFPKNRAAKIAIDAVQAHLEKHSIPQTVLFVCFDEENYDIYHQLL